MWSYTAWNSRQQLSNFLKSEGSRPLNLGIWALAGAMPTWKCNVSLPHRHDNVEHQANFKHMWIVSFSSLSSTCQFVHRYDWNTSRASLIQIALYYSVKTDLFCQPHFLSFGKNDIDWFFTLVRIIQFLHCYVCTSVSISYYIIIRIITACFFKYA